MERVKFSILIILVTFLSPAALLTNFSWTKILANGTPPAPRWGHCTLYHQGTHQMIIFGGVTNLNLSLQLNDVWAFDIATKKWKELLANGSSSNASVPTTRWAPGCVATDKGFILYGGTSYYGPENSTRDLWSFSLQQKEWTLLGYDNPATQFGRMPLVGLPIGQAAEMLLYADPTSSVWCLHLSSVKNGIAWQFLFNSSSVPPNERPTPTYLSNFAPAAPDGIYVTDYSDYGQGALWLYTISSGNWTLQSSGGNITTPGMRYNAVTIPFTNSSSSIDGFVLFAGARNPILYLNDVWLWTQSEKSWTLLLPEEDSTNVTRPMNREHLGAVALRANLMGIFGGLTSDEKGNRGEANDVWFGSPTENF